MLNKDQEYLLNHMNSTAQRLALGSKLRQQREKTVLAILDVGNINQGGAVGDINLLDEDGQAVILPLGAIVKDVLIDIVTVFTSTAGTGTVALKSQGAGDLLAAVDADTLANQVQGIPTRTVGTMIKMTADRTLKATVAVNALLTGKAHVYVTYVSAALV